MKKIILALVVCVLSLVGLELWLRTSLFEHASYSNSESIDTMIAQRDARDDWSMIFVGDSEVHWGIDPLQIDMAFERAGLPSNALNHAFDGFGPSWWLSILPPLLETESLRNVDTVVVGVQMIDAHSSLQDGEVQCGALQRPVLTSPLGIDLGVNWLCESSSWDSKLGRTLFDGLWTVRFSSAIRSLVLPAALFPSDRLAFNSAKDGPTINGFEPHRSIGDETASYESEYLRWKAQYDESSFRPLPPEVWTGMTSDGGFFDALNEAVAGSGRRLALFALPTNPRVIDTFNRREDYARNSRLLAQWAERHGVVFVDLGIRDSAPVTVEYSDTRHLSGRGARIYSKQLGEALATGFKRLGPAARAKD